MFWSSAPKPVEPEKPQYPSSFDPLKGFKGAAGFYQIFDRAATDPPKAPLKSGSAATFYAPAKDKIKKLRTDPDVDAAQPDAAGAGLAPLTRSTLTACPGVDQVNALLREGKEQLADGTSKRKIKVIMGSEVADLDATVCSLVYAAVAHRREAQGNAASGATCPVPVILTHRDDFRLRSETHWLLQSMGVDLDLLTFVNEVDLRKLHEQGRLQVVLVGIKNMPETFQGLESAVREVLPKPAVTAATASSSGIVINEDGYSGAVMLAKKLSEDSPEIFMNPALCRLLLASILVSTNNLDPTHSAEVDASMGAFLIIGARMLGYISFYEQLRDKKFNQTFLTTEELLRSDFAQHEMGPGTRGKKGGEVLRVGVSNVAISLAEMVGKDPEFTKKLNAFRAKHNLHAHFLLATYYSTTNRRFKKEIAFVTEIPNLLSNLSFFLQQERNELKLKGISIKNLPSVAKAFAVGNTIIMREDVEKRLLEYFDDGR